MRRRIIKTYESFVLNRRFKFEEKVIDPLLNIIKDNQEFLTTKENLPQLAKLGYIYETLWTVGRICWGYDGILLDPSLKKSDEEDDDNLYDFTSCEENPKYKIEMCDPMNDEIENLIYDAWGMHVSNDSECPTYETFSKLIKEGKPLTELEKKELKINKTIEDWVEIKTDKNYRYKSLFSDRKSVIRYLLCVIGTGYGWNKDGFIIEEASGADQDLALYGDWSNAKFTPEISKIVYGLLSIPEVKLTLDSANEYITKLREDRKKKEEESHGKSMKDLVSRVLKKGEDEELDEETEELIRSILRDFKTSGDSTKYPTSSGPKEERYEKYYPISSSACIYSIYSEESQKRLGIRKFDESYVKAAIEICEDIMAHEKQEEEGNVDFAMKLLLKFGHTEYDSRVEKEADKYSILKDVEEALLYVTDIFHKSNGNELNKGNYSLHLNDTAKNEYGDNSINFRLSLKGFNLPNFYSRDIKSISSVPFYVDFEDSLDRIKHIEGIKQIRTYFSKDMVEIKIFLTKKHFNVDLDEYEDYLESQGFEVGSFMMALKLKNIVLTCRKPEPLGSKHPQNKTGREIFSNNHQMSVLDKSWNEICNFSIDERGFNTLSLNSTKNKKISDWILEEFDKMKLSDPGYGTYGMDSNRDRKLEGKKNLLANDFFLWLKNNEK